MDLNRVTLIGNLTHDPVSKEIDQNKKFTVFTVATNRTYINSKTKEKVSDAQFHDIVAFGKLGEICENYLSKGSKTYLEGRINKRTWIDKNNQKHYKTEIVANEIIMLDKADSKVDRSSDSEEDIEEVDF